ncbi:hypothetical protein BH11ACT8_BH11ACT8_27640 [soil metagenome]
MYARARVTVVIQVVAVLAAMLAAAFAPGLAAGAAQADRGQDPTGATATSAKRSPSGPYRARTAEIGKVSAGGEFSCGIRGSRGGTLWCWGRNTYGQLGTGSKGPGPVPPTQVGTSSTWSQVSAGGSTTCGVRTNHQLQCWGLNHRGQVGDGATSPVVKPKLVTSAKTWKQVAVAWFHTCAVKTNGRLFCWGDNSHGQLGNGGTSTDRRPHRVPGTGWASVSVGGWTTCATKTDHSLWCWGRNTFGQLGAGDLVERHRPTQVGKAKVWAEVSLSWSHTCGRQRGGLVRCWGRNDRGQVGESADVYVKRPLRVADHRARSVATAEGSSCLVERDGSLWCWGDNRFGQVTSDTATASVNSVPSRRGGTYSSVSGGWFHFCATGAGGSSVCWGDNQRGQLGNDRASTPAPARLERTRARREGPLTFRLATLNTLSNSHTRPGADSDQYGPSRMRADWTVQALLNNGIDVAGLQEQDGGQLATILEGASGQLASFPAPEAGDLNVETSIVWNAAEYVAVETGVVRTQFIARTLARPVVKLRQVATGREFWVVDIHNAPNDYQSKRNKAVNQQLAKIRELEQTGLPVFYVGDFNEKATVFCKVLNGTGLVSASGGRLARNGSCVPPRYMRIDWLFGSAAAQWTGYAVEQPPLVRLSTDHHMVMADVTVP